MVEKSSRAKSVGRQTLRIQLGGGSEKTKVFLTNSTKGASRSPRDFLQTFFVNHFEQFSVPIFRDSFWKPWRENLSG